MADVSVEPATRTAMPARALSLVLFGMSGAGKTSLLAALVDAANSQPQLLNRALIDLDGSLTALRNRFHENPNQPTLEEIAAYRIHLDPLSAGGRKPERGIDAMLIDCNGSVANEILGTPQPLRADAIFLIVDSSAHAAELEALFVQFGRFLRLLEQYRGRQIDISGLPVFLVLTKSDLLARTADAADDWVERIEERKTQVAGRFKEFLGHNRDRRDSPFGRIDLHVCKSTTTMDK